MLLMSMRALRKIYWSVSCNLWAKSVFTKAETKAGNIAAGRGLQHQIRVQHCKQEASFHFPHTSIFEVVRVDGMIEFTCYARCCSGLFDSGQLFESFSFSFVGNIFPFWWIFTKKHEHCARCDCVGTFSFRMMQFCYPSNGFFTVLLFHVRTSSCRVLPSSSICSIAMASKNVIYFGFSLKLEKLPLKFSIWALWSMLAYCERACSVVLIVLKFHAPQMSFEEIFCN